MLQRFDSFLLKYSNVTKSTSMNGEVCLKEELLQFTQAKQKPCFLRILWNWNVVLYCYGITGTANNWFNTFLKNRYQFTNIKESSSEK